MSLKTRMLGLLAGLGLALSGASAHADGDFIILDILPIHEGKTLDDARAYFDAVEPIFAEHGMVRSDAVLEVTGILRGPVEAEVVNLWETDNPQASFDGIFADARYLEHTANRDSIFRLRDATIIITRREEGEQ